MPESCPQIGRGGLVDKLSRFIGLNPDELACLAELQSRPRLLAPKSELVYEGQSDHRAYIIQRGWACSYKMLPNGARQIITFSVPGDFVGLRSLLLRASDHAAATITEALVTPIDVLRLTRVISDYPRVGTALLWAISRDEAITVEHLVGVGRRKPIERVAFFFLELRERLQQVGLASTDKFHLPLNQYLIADALGLTAIHLNRVLRQLRERGFVSVERNYVVFGDIAALGALAGYPDSFCGRED